VDAPSDALALEALAADAAVALAAAGVDNARSEATWMVEDAAGLTPGGLVVEGESPATVGAVRRVRQMVARRVRGEPLQYVLGHWSFRTLDLMVDPRVLIPRPETEEVVGVALAELDRLVAGRDPGERRPPVVVDLGTGSGAIALAVAVERPGTEVVATDRSADALAVAAANLAGIGTAAASVQLCEGHWFDALERHRPDLAAGVDVIVSNPPYIAAGEDLPPEVADFEPVGALVAGARGTESLEQLVRGASRWLRSDGVLVLECAPRQAPAVAALARAHAFPSVDVVPDLTGRDRAVVARRDDAALWETARGRDRRR
jgi:release factor glutamine methyltransferase